jgi:hypothetical protein
MPQHPADDHTKPVPDYGDRIGDDDKSSDEDDE